MNEWGEACMAIPQSCYIHRVTYSRNNPVAYVLVQKLVMNPNCMNYTDSIYIVYDSSKFEHSWLVVMGIGHIFKIDDRDTNIDQWSIIDDNYLLNVFTDYDLK